MKKNCWSKVIVAMMAAAAILVGGCSKEAEKMDQASLENLQKAFDGESNAAAKYAMYAEKAAENGYQSVAALFRAASKSEGMHAKRHSEVIRSMGAEPVANIKLPVYVDVATSLKDAIKGETYEFTVMYPEFIATAKANGSDEAQEAFQFAMTAEKEHAKFYSDALANLEAWKAPGKEFYVCTVCGYTTDSKAMMVCILCAAPKEKFEVFK